MAAEQQSRAPQLLQDSLTVHARASLSAANCADRDGAEGLGAGAYLEPVLKCAGKRTVGQPPRQSNCSKQEPGLGVGAKARYGKPRHSGGWAWDGPGIAGSCCALAGPGSPGFETSGDLHSSCML
jgi:hypothetical protein